MIEASVKLKSFFEQYIKAVAHYDLLLVRQCYLLPCTLNTPESVVLLADEHIFIDTFEKIFSQLKNADITGFKVSNISYQHIKHDLLLVNIDWQFIQRDNTLFTAFSAIYHIVLHNDEYKIVNVISQELSQGLVLENLLELKQ